ncbi:MAG: hypothetical protein V4506_18980 [Bacteroidota bacterium]
MEKNSANTGFSEDTIIENPSSKSVTKTKAKKAAPVKKGKLNGHKKIVDLPMPKMDCWIINNF